MKREEFKTIWSQPKSLAFVQPPLTDEMVRDAENRIGHKLPEELIEILKVQNGGYIRYALPNNVPGVCDIPHREIMGIGPHFMSILDFEDLWCNLDDEEDADEIATMRGLVLFDGDGHWFLCLDYRGGKTEPTVTFKDLENNEELKVAGSFREYLSLLELEVRFEQVMEATGTTAETVELVARILNTSFEETPRWNYEYSGYRGKYNGYTLSLYPNQVPGGYIAEKEKRYEEQKWQLETTALQYPEIPAAHLFIDPDEEIEAAVFAELARNNIRVYSFREEMTGRGIAICPKEADEEYNLDSKISGTLGQAVFSNVLGPMTQYESDDWWRSEVITTPLLEGKALAVIYSGYIPGNDETFIAEADAAISEFLALEPAYRAGISQHVTAKCKEVVEMADDDYEEIKTILHLNDPGGIWQFVHPLEVCVQRHQKDKHMYVMLNCDCDWDPEHGLQLIFRDGKKLTRVADQDGYLTSADAFGLPEGQGEPVDGFNGSGLAPHLRDVDAEVILAKSASSAPVQEEYLKILLEQHETFLANGGGGGTYSYVSVAGIPLNTYTTAGPEPQQGKQLELTLKKLAPRAEVNGKNLSYAWLSALFAEGVDFSRCDLTGTMLTDGYFTGADFTGANLTRADFSGSCLRNVSFRNAILDQTDFENANLEGADFTGADTLAGLFRGADLQGVKR